MRILIVTPAPEEAQTGNRRTALRWAALLSQLDHTPRIVERYDGEECDLMIALHATRSARSIEQFHRDRPGRPLLVALTGTDLYDDLPRNRETRHSIDLATRLIALQPLAEQALPPAVHPKLRVILQSVEPLPELPPTATDTFDVCVLANLRRVKDPFRAAEAVRLLPAESRVLLTHVGAALEPDARWRADEEEATNPRFRWVGERPWDEALRILAGSRLLVLSSVMEGGANVVGEAVVHGIPVVASRIPGSVGLLGQDYPGYFEVGDTEALASLIRRAESESEFLDDLRRRCCSLADRFAPERELTAWRALLNE